jgi:hypothetical protein
VPCLATAGAAPAAFTAPALPAVEQRILISHDTLPLLMKQVDTEGRIASDSFFVTYHGEPLNQSMVQLVTNALQVGLS